MVIINRFENLFYYNAYTQYNIIYFTLVESTTAICIILCEGLGECDTIQYIEQLMQNAEHFSRGGEQ